MFRQTIKWVNSDPIGESGFEILRYRNSRLHMTATNGEAKATHLKVNTGAVIIFHR
jgi:hypothetical protein